MVRYRYLFALIVAGALAFLAGTYQAATDPHNGLGGYREACGDLPGMVGDDC